MWSIDIDFAFIFYRNEELTSMLDSNKDGQKLDAMKIIIGVCYMRTAKFQFRHEHIVKWFYWPFYI